MSITNQAIVEAEQREAQILAQQKEAKLIAERERMTAQSSPGRMQGTGPEPVNVPQTAATVAGGNQNSAGRAQSESQLESSSNLMNNMLPFLLLQGGLGGQSALPASNYQPQSNNILDNLTSKSAGGIGGIIGAETDAKYRGETIKLADKQIDGSTTVSAAKSQAEKSASDNLLAGQVSKIVDTTKRVTGYTGNSGKIRAALYANLFAS